MAGEVGSSDAKIFQRQLKKVLHYDPETGVFRWLVSRHGGAKKCDVAGLTAMPNGKPSTVHITVFCKRYVAHDLAFVIMTGKWPRMKVRHIDKCSQNNAWENLTDTEYVPEKHEITPEFLRSILDYNPKTGKFRWKSRKSNNSSRGWFYGSPDTYGRYQINIEGRQMKSHQLAWIIFHGVFPKYEIAHDDGDHQNNRISNLDDISHIENMRNQKKRSTNKSGVTGVRWRPDRNRLTARIKVNYKTINLGHFETIEEAAEARKKAEKQYGFHADHGKRE